MNSLDKHSSSSSAAAADDESSSVHVHEYTGDNGDSETSDANERDERAKNGDDERDTVIVDKLLDSSFDRYTKCSLVSYATPKMLSMTTLFIVLVLFEASKLNDCLHNEADLQNRDFDASAESVCSEPVKLQRYSHRFGEGCREARKNVDKGIVYAATDCFVKSHTVYAILAFEHTTFNYTAIGTILVVFMYFLKLVKEYFVERDVRKAQIESTERMSREQMAMMREYSSRNRETLPLLVGNQEHDAARVEEIFLAAKKKRAIDHLS